jgi:hypothetical protein
MMRMRLWALGIGVGLAILNVLPAFAAAKGVVWGD